MNVTIFAAILFVITYVLMFAFQKIRPYVAVLSAVIFVVVGSTGIFPDFRYTVGDALGQIDWNVILMITGTMGTVFLFIQSKMPQRMSDILVSHTHSVKWLVVVLSLFAGVISAFVDNVATVLMVAPVALALCKKLHISPVPAIICIAISSNLQGAATLVGDTTSILLAKAAGLDFMDFFFVDGRPGMFWVTECGALLSALIILWFFREENAAIDLHDRTPVEDKGPTRLLCLTVASLIAVSFIPYQSAAQPGQFYKPEITNGLICMFFFVIGLIREVRRSGSREIIGRAILEHDFTPWPCWPVCSWSSAASAAPALSPCWAPPWPASAAMAPAAPSSSSTPSSCGCPWPAPPSSTTFPTPPPCCLWWPWSRSGSAPPAAWRWSRI